MREYWIINPVKRYMVKFNLTDFDPPELHFLDDKSIIRILL